MVVGCFSFFFRQFFFLYFFNVALKVVFIAACQHVKRVRCLHTQVYQFLYTILMTGARGGRRTRQAVTWMALEFRP